MKWRVLQVREEWGNDDCALVLPTMKDNNIARTNFRVARFETPFAAAVAVRDDALCPERCVILPCPE